MRLHSAIPALALALCLAALPARGQFAHEDISKPDTVTTVNLAKKKGTLHHADIAALGKFHNLQTLHLEHDRITDSAYSLLGHYTSLRTLVLSGANVTDVYLDHLNTLIQLRYLDLSGTRVTNVGLRDIDFMPNLQVLNLTGSKVDLNGLDVLHKRHPNLQIRYSRPHPNPLNLNDSFLPDYEGVQSGRVAASPGVN